MVSATKSIVKATQIITLLTTTPITMASTESPAWLWGSANILFNRRHWLLGS